MPTFEYLIFDEGNSNLLSYSDYQSHPQRAVGFQSNQEIISSVFNNALKQATSITYQIAKYISDTTSVSFTYSMTSSALADNITNFFNNFQAARATIADNLNVTNFTKRSLLYVSESHVVDVIESTTQKSLLVSEDKNMEFKPLVKFNASETVIDSSDYFYCNTGISYTNLQNYVLELYIINLSSGNRIINRYEFNISDLPGLSFTYNQQNIIPYDDSFKLKVYYDRYDGTRRYFYLGVAETVQSTSPSKGQYIVAVNDSSGNGFDLCRYKLQIKEKL